MLEIKGVFLNWVWWLLSVIAALGRLRQENHEFKANLVYIERSYLRKTKQNKKVFS
jgi:hypothetical protein